MDQLCCFFYKFWSDILKDVSELRKSALNASNLEKLKKRKYIEAINSDWYMVTTEPLRAGILLPLKILTKTKQNPNLCVPLSGRFLSNLLWSLSVSGRHCI